MELLVTVRNVPVFSKFNALFVWPNVCPVNSTRFLLAIKTDLSCRPRISNVAH